ncbi:MAG: hemolysin family protein [Mycoplasmatales bacterium]
MSLIILIFIILFIFTAILASLEMAISSANKLRIKTKAQKKDKKAIKVLNLIENYDRTLTTIIVLNNIINIILPTISTVIFIRIFIDNQELGIVISTVFLTILLLMFGEIIPKTYGKKNSEKMLFGFARFIDIIVKLFKPLTYLFLLVNGLVKDKLFNTKEEDIEVEEELLTMIEESSQGGGLEKNEGELLRNAIEFNDIRVDEILQPKNNMIMIDITEKNSSIFNILSEEKYSRIPVYKDTTDNIVGLISERDFLRAYIKNKDFKLKNILREIDFIPDTLKVSKLLPEMQKKHSNISIVVDEYGTVQGLITVEDIIEELVGEIWDEHDEVIVEYTKVSENLYHVLGTMTLDDFNKIFEQENIDTETEDSTIAGYLLEKAERIPAIGEQFEDDSFVYKILKVDNNKIEMIEVRSKNDL